MARRHGGCRVPGCPRTKWLHVHHIVHWEDGGATDTFNLMAVCSKHHRLHHRGHLGISGDADDPDGITFTDAKGQLLAPAGKPVPPPEPPPTGNWVHPTGERLDPACVVFSPPPGTTPAAATITPAAVASPASAWSDHPERDYPPFINLDDPGWGAQDEPHVWFG